MRTAKQIDMTQGPIMKAVILFGLPICIGNILQQLYNTVDTLVVGNYCGTVSLAAIGTSAQPVEMLLCIFLGLGSGVSILVSQYVGRSDSRRLKDVISTAISFLYLCGVPLSLLGFLIGPFVLKIMQVPEDTWNYCISYLNIIFLGTLGNLGYNMNAGILRGLGDSKSSLIFLFLSCALNIVLDLLFVAVFKMDVAGAALATIIAMFASWFFSIVYIKKNYPELAFTWLPRHLDKGMLRQIIRIGLPLGLNNSIYSVGHIVLQSLINLQGAAFIAGCSVASKVTGIANIAIVSLSTAATTFSGQNIGAGNYTRLRKGAFRIPFYSGLLNCSLELLVTFFSRPILGFFTQDAAVLEIAVQYIWIVLPFTWTYAVFNAIISFVNGMGEVRYPTISNLLTLWAVRIPAAWLITWVIGGQYCMAAYPISFIFGMIAMLLYFQSKHWKTIRERACGQEQDKRMPA